MNITLTYPHLFHISLSTGTIAHSAVHKASLLESNLQANFGEFNLSHYSKHDLIGPVVKLLLFIGLRSILKHHINNLYLFLNPGSLGLKVFEVFGLRDRTCWTHAENKFWFCLKKKPLYRPTVHLFICVKWLWHFCTADLQSDICHFYIRQEVLFLEQWV